MKKKDVVIIVSALFCCILMAIVDGIIMPGYIIKSIIKIITFLIIPFICCRIFKDIRFKELFIPDKKGIGVALILGCIVYGIILGGYHIFKNIFDFSSIAKSLTSSTGVDRNNFLYVSIYISLVNSMMEEFFFRGFVFKNITNKKIAYVFSSSIFALYHVAMMIGWFDIWVFLLVMTGLFLGGILFNFLNEKFKTVYVSWTVHMFANFAINTIGFILL